MDDDKTHTGGCLCGANRYEARGAPFWVGHCHCKTCRRQTGAPVVTLVGFRKDQVTFKKGERALYESSPGVGRGFCRDCGTPLTWEAMSTQGNGPIVEVYISTLDDPDAFAPENHSWYSQRIAWFDVADDLPRHHGFDFSSEVVQVGPGK